MNKSNTPTKECELMYDFVLENGEVIPSEQLEFVSCGSNSSIWKWDNGNHIRAVKSFFDKCYVFSLRPNVLSEMKGLDFLNLPNIYSSLQRIPSSSMAYDGYLMDYFIEDKNTILSELPSDNLILSLEQIEEDARMLSDHQIVMYDIKPVNSIITQDDLLLHFLDLDLYKKVDSKSREEILLIQYKRICSFLSIGLRDEIKKDDSFSEDQKMKISFFIQDYFQLSTDDTLKPSERVENLFSNVDSPKQYFKERF